METITYEWVYGAPPGQPIRSAPKRYRACPAVSQLRSLLASYHVFPSLGGEGPHHVNNRIEFSRHQAGLALDIMIPPSNSALVALGQHLFKLFIDYKHILRWRGMIYQHVSMTFGGHRNARLMRFNWRGDDHENHIHIDWHDSRNVTWVTVETIPLLSRDGSRQISVLRPRDANNRIAESITWTMEASTIFQHDPNLNREISSLMSRRGSLPPLDLAREVGLSR
jgi:hypothetical protein